MNSVPFPTALLGLEPAAVWRHFAEFAARPRPSGLEEGVRNYVLAWSESRGFESHVDAIGNVVVKVPGRGEGVGAPAVILQGHMDMVCEKNEDTEHDFDVDPIRLIRREDLIVADGTTLGADNGIGVALSMAAADGVFADHPPLEILLTVDEETGMSGARELDTSMLTAKRMINLDAEEEGTLYVGCAGGQDTHAFLTVTRESAPEGMVPLEIRLKGLKGGHSGLDIICNRGNAVRLLASALRSVSTKVPLRLVNFVGGSKRNAIPREAKATVLVEKSHAASARSALEGLTSQLHALHGDSEGQVILEVQTSASGGEPMVAADSARLLRFLTMSPNGVMTMSQAVPGLVETSSNLGVVEQSGDDFNVIFCTRSSNMPALEQACIQISDTADANGLGWRREGGYPGWQPDMKSEMLAITKQVFTELQGGEAPEVTAIHAGLECGLLGALMPGLDMISFGPDIRGAHSPDEQVSIRSVAVVAQQVEALLKALCRD